MGSETSVFARGGIVQTTTAFRKPSQNHNHPHPQTTAPLFVIPQRSRGICCPFPTTKSGCPIHAASSHGWGPRRASLLGVASSKPRQPSANPPKITITLIPKRQPHYLSFRSAAEESAVLSQPPNLGAPFMRLHRMDGVRDERLCSGWHRPNHDSLPQTLPKSQSPSSPNDSPIICHSAAQRRNLLSFPNHQIWVPHSCGFIAWVGWMPDRDGWENSEPLSRRQTCSVEAMDRVQGLLYSLPHETNLQIVDDRVYLVCHCLPR